MDNRQYRKLSSYDTVENPDSQDLIPTIHTQEGGRKVNRNIPVSTFKDYTDTEVSTLDSSLATVAKTGSYDDLSNKPTIPSTAGLATEAQVQDVQDNLDAHEADTANPHNVTKAQVGLGNVDNTSDANKPVSTATQTALDGKVDKTNLANRVHTTNAAGSESVSMSYDTAASNGTMAVRTGSGQLLAADATVPSGLTTKGQMDAAGALKVNKAGDTMTGELHVNLSSGLAIRQTRGSQTMLFGTTSDASFGVFDATNPSTIFRAFQGGISLGPSSSPNILNGTGFPNGVVSAPVGSIYIDKNVTNGASSWIKKSGTGNTGWQVLEGDTGWRNIGALIINGWTTTQAYIRRAGTSVELVLNAVNASASTSGILMYIPTGFAPDTFFGSTRGNLGTAAGPSAMYRFDVSSAVISQNYATTLPTMYGRIMWNAATTTPWPTTLPGTAA